MKVVKKYFEHKRRELLFVGLTAILITEPWWPSAFGFLAILITGTALPDVILLLLGVFLIPMLCLFWLTAFTDLLFKEYQRKILKGFIIYGTIFEVILIMSLIFDPKLIGTISGYFDPNYGLFVRAYEISLLGVILITGTLFARESMKSDIPEIKLKGKFILIAIYSFIIGGALDIIALVNFPSLTSIILMVTARAILLTCAIEFYIGLIMPERVKKLLLM